MAVEVGPEVGLDASEGQADTARSEVLLKFADDASGGEVHIGDCAGIDYEPAQGGRRGSGKHARLHGEAIDVCVKKRCAESIEDYAGLGDGARSDWIELPYAVATLFQDVGVRIVAVMDDAKQRHGHREDNSLLHSD